MIQLISGVLLYDPVVGLSISKNIRLDTM